MFIMRGGDSFSKSNLVPASSTAASWFQILLSCSSVFWCLNSSARSLRKSSKVAAASASAMEDSRGGHSGGMATPCQLPATGMHNKVYNGPSKTSTLGNTPEACEGGASPPSLDRDRPTGCACNTWRAPGDRVPNPKMNSYPRA